MFIHNGIKYKERRTRYSYIIDRVEGGYGIVFPPRTSQEEAIVYLSEPPKPNKPINRRVTRQIKESE